MNEDIKAPETTNGATPNPVPAPEPKPFSFATLASLRARKDRPYKDIDVPEWELKVRLAVMKGSDRQEFVTLLAKIRKETPDVEDQNVRISEVKMFLLSRTIVDPETFQPLFTNDDVSVLAEKDFLVTDRLFVEAKKLNAIGIDEEEEAAGN